MNKNDFQAAFAANISRESNLVEGQFISANPEQMKISGYVQDGRIYGSHSSRLGGILKANVDVTVHIYQDFAYDHLLERGEGTYHKNLQVTLIGWQVEVASNGYTDWLQKTPVYEAKQTLKEVRCGFFLRPGVARWGNKKYDPFWDEYIVNTVKLGVNPNITRNDDIPL